jgi:hypothetical protein
MRPVTLQINLTPRDFRFAKYLLPHQIRQWGDQVAEILLVIESRRSKGEFGEHWKEGLRSIYALAHSIPNARVISVDYSLKAQHQVASEFFGVRRSMPPKDARGGPYYAYFYGLSQAANNLVLHSDSDMYFGGGSQTWLQEAVEIFDAHADVLIVNPYMSPPSSSGFLDDFFQPQLKGTRETKSGPSLIFDYVTTRVFLMNKQKFFERLCPLQMVPKWHVHPIREWIWYFQGRNPNAEFPEQIVTLAMQRRKLITLHYLGKAPGMWCLHPPWPLFSGYFDMLPQLVNRIETGDIPEAQRGCGVMNESMKA